MPRPKTKGLTHMDVFAAVYAAPIAEAELLYSAALDAIQRRRAVNKPAKAGAPEGDRRGPGRPRKVATDAEAA